MQLAADPADIAVIKKVFGSRAQTIINALLAWDAFFAWYYPFKESIPLFCSMEQREERAFDNFCRAVDMHEAFERVTIRAHKSFLPHLAIFKVSRDILHVGDIWAFCVSALELQNAETKRTATSCGSRRKTITTEGVLRVPLGPGKQGPANLIKTKGYSTTQALSTLNHLLVTKVLHEGSGLYATPESRRKERLFGEHGAGRTKLPSSGVKLEARLMEAKGYSPCADTCIRAFVRMLAVRASEF